MQKKYDLAVKTGSYTNRDGEEKGRYVNIGSVMQKDDGGEFILLNRTFNPAGVPNPENRDTILVSKFPVKDAQEHSKAKGNAYADKDQGYVDSADPF